MQDFKFSFISLCLKDITNNIYTINNIIISYDGISGTSRSLHELKQIRRGIGRSKNKQKQEAEKIGILLNSGDF